MLTYCQARIHAQSCGISLDACDAVPLDKIVSRSKSGRGAWLAYDVLHPETQKPVMVQGQWIDTSDVETLKGMGLDYVLLQE
jgi:hypothetical protein